MKNIIRSCFDKTDQAYIDYLEQFIIEASNYDKVFKVKNLLKDAERKYFDYIISTYNSSGNTPSMYLFEGNFPETKGSFANAVEIPIQDLRTYIYNLIDMRINSYIHDKINQLNQKVMSSGITVEISDEFNNLQALSNRNKAKEIDIKIDAKREYDLKKLRPSGLKTGIKEIDDRIGGMNQGTVTTIAGFTGQYKTTFALNIARLNAYEFGYNIAYLSLETPKQDMYWNLLSRHSYETKFPKFNFIGHDRIRQCKLTQEEEDFLFNEVEKDLNGTFTDDYGNTYDRGKVVILDESDFSTFSFGEVTAVLEKVDDELGGKLDAVIVDYVQLCKFSDSGVSYDANSQINSYVTFFRRLSQNFRKEVDPNGNESTRQLTMILLAQLNRTGWQKACRNNGVYALDALADANELERGSARIFTTFTTEDMKARKSAQVQILKNRTGQTLYEPVTVYADGEAYVFMDEDSSAGSTWGSGSASGTASIEAAFSGLDNDLLSDLGI